MMTRIRFGQLRKPVNAFTLVEMLTVMSVIILLLLVVTPAVSGSMRSMRLQTGAQQVMDEVQSARTLALARNLPVELCFQRGPEERSGFFFHLATRLVRSDGTVEQVYRARKLPKGMAMIGSASLSPLLGGQIESELPSGGVEVTLQFMPSGELVMPQLGEVSPDGFFMTLGPEQEWSVDGGVLPDFFACIRIDPRNSQPTLYLP